MIWQQDLAAAQLANMVLEWPDRLFGQRLLVLAQVSQGCQLGTFILGCEQLTTSFSCGTRMRSYMYTLLTKILS